jgi:hypothetical protein
MPLDEFPVGLGDRFRIGAVPLQVTAADGIDHQGLQLRRRHPADSRRVLPQSRRRDIVEVAHPFLVGVSRGHALAVLIEQTPA